jgi:cytochrome P450
MVTRVSPEDFTLIPDENPEKIHAQFDALRSKCPVAHSTTNGGYWVLSRYEDVQCWATDHEMFVSSIKAVIPSDPRGARRPPLNTDPPAHTPYRTALERSLKPTRIKRLAPILTEHSRREFSKIVERHHGDVCAEFRASFAAWVEVSWLNLTDETAPKLATTVAAQINSWRL